MDTTYREETVSEDNMGVTWDSALNEATPDISMVSEGGYALGMPSIINVQESGLRR